MTCRRVRPITGQRRPHRPPEALRAVVRAVVSALALWVVRPLRDALRTLRRRHPVRVFTYHRVSDACRDAITISPSELRRQLRYILRYHRVVDLPEAVHLLTADTRLSRPAAVITFDDGYRSVGEEAAPILRELGLPACCFVVTDYVDTSRGFPWDTHGALGGHGSPGVMGWQELHALLEQGWSVGAHSASHPSLARCDPETLWRELNEPVAILRAHLGLDTVAMAYPFGSANDVTRDVVQLAERVGYTAAFLNSGGENFPPAAPHALRRIDVGGDLSTLVWKGRVHGLDPAALARTAAWLLRRSARNRRPIAGPSDSAERSATRPASDMRPASGIASFPEGA